MSRFGGKRNVALGVVVNYQDIKDYVLIDSFVIFELKIYMQISTRLSMNE